MTSNLRSILVETFSSVGGRVSPSRGARRLARGWHAARGGRRSALGRSAPDARSAVGTRPALFMHKPVNFHHEVALADGLMHRVVNFTHEGAHGGRRRAGDGAHLTRGTRPDIVTQWRPTPLHRSASNCLLTRPSLRVAMNFTPCLRSILHPRRDAFYTLRASDKKVSVTYFSSSHNISPITQASLRHHSDSHSDSE